MIPVHRNLIAASTCFGMKLGRRTLAFCCVLASGCDDGGGRAFQGSYEVPVPAELAAAATYPVSKVEWSVDGDSVELRYDLPVGLIGKAVRLSFEGQLAASGTSASLVGDAGTAECVISRDVVDCHEIMRGLLPLDPNYDVVEAHAASEYAGPAADRVEVAKRFAGDPIGIVHIDLTASGDDADAN